MRTKREKSTRHPGLITLVAKHSSVCAAIQIVLLVSSPALGTFAQSIHAFDPGDPIRTIAPIENILGAPDMATHPWESTGCIGHLGSVVVDMGAVGFCDIPGADDIFLWFGGWTDAGYREVVEGLKLEASIDGLQFHFVGELPKGNNVDPPVALFRESMDLAASGLPRARYLRISDTGTDQAYGGLELNAIEAKVPEPATIVMLGLGSLMFLKKRNKRGAKNCL